MACSRVSKEEKKGREIRGRREWMDADLDEAGGVKLWKMGRWGGGS